MKASRITNPTVMLMTIKAEEYDMPVHCSDAEGLILKVNYPLSVLAWLGFREIAQNTTSYSSSQLDLLMTGWKQGGLL